MAKTYTLVFGTGDPRQYSGLSPTMLIFANAATGATLAAPAITEVLSATCGIYKFTWGTTTPIAFLADAATTSPGTSGRYVYGQIDPADRADEYGTTMIAIGTTLFGQGVTNIALGTTNIGFGVTNIALGTSNIALGTSNIALGVSNFALGVSNLALGVSNLAQGSTILGYGISIYAGIAALGNSIAVIGVSLGDLAALIGNTTSSFGNSSTDPSTLFGYLKRVQENLEGDSQYVKVTGIWSIYDRAQSVTLAVKTITNNATLVIKT